MRERRNQDWMDWVRAYRRKWLMIEVVCAALCIALLGTVAYRLKAGADIRGEEQSAGLLRSAMLQSTVSARQIPQGTDALGITPLSEETRALFSDLKAENGDFVGVLDFGEGNSVYVVQGSDNTFYMNHRFDGSSNAAGNIFMDCRNSLSPRSDNLILYGHNMKNGSRFGTLKYYENESFLRAHPVFTWTTEAGSEEYVPVALFLTSVNVNSPDYYDFDRTNFIDQSDFDAYLEGAMERSVFETGWDANYGDKLLTMATCTSELNDGRLVIICRQLLPAEQARTL